MSNSSRQEARGYVGGGGEGGGGSRPHRRRSGSLIWLLYTTLVTVYDSQARQIQATRQDRDERLPSFEKPY